MSEHRATCRVMVLRCTFRELVRKPKIASILSRRLEKGCDRRRVTQPRAGCHAVVRTIIVLCTLQETQQHRILNPNVLRAHNKNTQKEEKQAM